MLTSRVGRAATIGMLLALGVVPAWAHAAGRLAPIDDRLAAVLASPVPAAGVRVRVSLRSDDLPAGIAPRLPLVSARQQRVLDAAIPAGFQLGYRYTYLSGFSGFAAQGAIEALRRHPEVQAIHFDWEVHATLSQGGALIGSGTAHSLGFTGDGINIAVLDTGIDTDHPGLMDDLVAEQCYCDNHPSPQFGCCPSGGQVQSGPGSAEDDEGHGTSVSGIITSLFGIAPDSGIVAVKVLAANGTGFSSSIDAGLDWVVMNHTTHGIRVVSMSLGDGGEHNNPSSSICNGTPTDAAIEALALAGVVTFAASGNDAFDNGIQEPACIAEAISVGGAYDASLGNVSWCGNASCTTILCTDTATQADDFVCHTSSDEILDLLAPNWQTTTSALGGGATSFGGTSASCPYAAAQAALLLDADPSLTPADIRTRMKAFGPMVTNPDNGLAFRRTAIGGAIQDLLATCGNSVVEPGEDCDDGNTKGGDCCSGTCQFESMGSACDDSDLCTTSDVCDGAGTCGGAPVLCDDTNVCTDDSCNAGTGACDFVPNTDPCDDSDLCTTSDVCDGAGTCGGTPVLCDDTNVCTDDSCNAGTGACDFVPNTDPCDDGDACTSADICAAGTCASGPPLDCDDGNFCTADACDGIEGCTNTVIVGCNAEVPASGAAGRLLLGLLVLASGVAVLRIRARAQQHLA